MRAKSTLKLQNLYFDFCAAKIQKEVKTITKKTLRLSNEALTSFLSNSQNL